MRAKTRLTGSRGAGLDPRTDRGRVDLCALGWRQGSIVPRSLAEALAALAPREVILAATDLIVTVSHDCDLCQPDEAKEPWAELLRIATDRRKPDGRSTLLKSPRDLHFRSQIEGVSVVCAASAADRWLVPRGRLATTSPSGHLDTQPADLIATWLSRRYIRAALPNAFNERARPAVESCKSVLAEHGEALAGVYLIVDSDEKLPGDEYRVVVRGTMLETDWQVEARRIAAQTTLNAIEAALDGAEGITVVDSLLRSEAEVSLHDARAMKRWDLFDASSIRGDVPAAPYGKAPGA